MHLNGNLLPNPQLPLDIRCIINSHDFKFSMMPFSKYNNSEDVNLFHPNSKIPYLLKENFDPYHQSGAAVPGHQTSLFFRCYSDDIYEAILEDLRAHYIAISNQDLEGDDEIQNDN